MINSSPLLYQTTAIRALEQLAVEAGTSIATLMERAGSAAWKVLQSEWPHASSIGVICGKGNNAGDGYVVARLAQQAGFKVKVWQLFPHAQTSGAGAALEAARACQQSGVKFTPFAREKFICDAVEADVDVIVDAVLGTGLRGTLSEEYQDAINAVNELRVPILALDVPSGLLANSGATASGVAVRAAVTVTFLAAKCGLVTGEAAGFCGKIICDNLDLPKDIFTRAAPSARVLDLTTLLHHLPARPRSAHKGNFGHILVIGGDHGMGGAVRMAAEAAARVGAGLVSVATRKEHVSAINAARPEIMCHGVTAASALKPLLERATCILLGPGLGQSVWSKMLFKSILRESMQRYMPLIVDADGLNLLAQETQKKLRQGANWILTPHPGEAARLLGCTALEVQRDRYQALAALRRKFGGVVVLKGAGTMIGSVHVANSEEHHKQISGELLTTVCPYGNPGMASGGMGDILGGAIGGLVAQGMPLLAAAQLGVCLHSKAADIAAAECGERGLLALDLLGVMRKLLNVHS